MTFLADRAAYHRFVWATLAYNLGVIAWGAYVRATGSGAGCGNHWPTCNGDLVPRAPTVETMIEYSHRITSGLALVSVIVVLVYAFKRFDRGHRVRKAALASFVLMLSEAGIGAGLVLFELVADNASIARALFMATHLGNTFLLLGAITLTAYWAGGGAPLRLADRFTRWAALGLFTAFLIGVSGAVAALGDTLFPAGSFKEGLLQDLSATSHLLIKLRVYHPLIAFAGSALLLHLVARIRREKRPQPARTYASVVNVVVILQLAAGGLNILLNVPVWMQLVHLLLADVLWISLVLALAASLGVAEDAPSAPA